jgi:hypothetical protein
MSSIEFGKPENNEIELALEFDNTYLLFPFATC